MAQALTLGQGHHLQALQGFGEPVFLSGSLGQQGVIQGQLPEEHDLVLKVKSATGIRGRLFVHEGEIEIGSDAFWQFVWQATTTFSARWPTAIAQGVFLTFRVLLGRGEWV